jgi:hypothetical protein
LLLRLVQQFRCNSPHKHEDGCRNNIILQTDSIAFHTYRVYLSYYSPGQLNINSAYFFCKHLHHQSSHLYHVHIIFSRKTSCCLLRRSGAKSPELRKIQIWKLVNDCTLLSCHNVWGKVGKLDTIWTNFRIYRCLLFFALSEYVVKMTTFRQVSSISSHRLRKKRRPPRSLLSNRTLIHL